jgi:hypothetical protein
MIDQTFASLTARYISQKYGIPAPTVVITDKIPPNYIGLYMDHGIRKIELSPQADIRVLLHEVGHHVFAHKNIKFPSEADEERAANRFAEEEARKLGIKLQIKPYTLTMKVKGDPEKLVNELVRREDEIGITLKGYRIRGNELDVLFYPHYPLTEQGLVLPQKAGVKYLAPIVWAIIAVAALIGAAVLAWQIKEAAQQIPSWVGPLAVLIAGGVVIYLISRK